MAIKCIVYAAIPDEKIFEAQFAAEAICSNSEGTCDWEFHNDVVKYTFTAPKPWSAFIAHCAVAGWKLARKLP